MALTDRSIVTLNNVKDYLGLGTGMGYKDDMLEEWIDWVSGKFEAEIENVVNVQEKTVYVDGSGESFLYLPYYPIVELATPDTSDLQYRSTATADWEDLVESTDLIHISTEANDRLELLDGYTFPVGSKNIKVKYNAGHSSVPGDIVIAVIEAIQLMWNNSRQGQSGLGMGSQTMTTPMGSASISFLDGTPRWKEVVRRYKKLVHTAEMYR